MPDPVAAEPNRVRAETPRPGQIHDLGYRRYDGVRLPPPKRWGSIARNLVRIGWRMKWGVRLPLLMVLLTVLGASTFIVLLGNQIAEKFRAMGAAIPQGEIALYGSSYFFSIAGFLLAMSAVAGPVADDFKRGAFQFYFSRPLLPLHYVLGKLLGGFLLVGAAMFAGPLLVGLMRLSLADSPGEVVRLLPFVGKAALLGVLGTLGLVAPALACGAVMQSRRQAQILYVAFVWLLGGMARAIGRLADSDWVRLLAVNEDIINFARVLVGVPDRSWNASLPGWAYPGALLILTAVSLWLFHRRVRSTETSGLGEGA